MCFARPCFICFSERASVLGSFVLGAIVASPVVSAMYARAATCFDAAAGYVFFAADFS